MRHAFVTGGAGFLGRQVIHSLARRGWRITALVRRQLEIPGAALALADLRDRACVLAAMPDEVDAVFHIAANIDFNASRAQQFSDNLDGTENLLAAALARRARRFVFTSTAGVWGLDHQRFDEASSRHPTGIAYLDSKVAAEAAVQRAIQRGLHAVILNPGHIVGRGSGWDSLFRGLRAAQVLAVPSGAASWCHVDAVARAEVEAADHGENGANYLLGGCDASYVEFSAAVASQLGVRAPRAAPAVLVHTMARVGSWRAKLSGRTSELTPDLAKIMCARMLFSSARAADALDYRPPELAALIQSSLPLAVPSSDWQGV